MIARLDRREALALLGAVGLATPLTSRAAEEPVSTLPEAEYAGDGHDEIVTMSDGGRRMTAPVMINGQGPFDFMVDTGTNRSVISDALVAALALPAGPQARLHGITGSEVVGTAKLDSFRIGDREARRLTLAALPARYLQADGILGVDGLKNQRVVLDFNANSLRIEPSGSAPADAAVAPIRARRRFGQLTVVDTDLAGTRVSVMMDTGSEVSVGNSALRKLVDRRLGPDQPIQRVSLLGATGDRAFGDYGYLGEFRLGRLTIKNLRLVYADLHPFHLWELSSRPAMLLGVDLMRFFERVSLDYGRNEVRLVMPDQPFLDPAGDRGPS